MTNTERLLLAMAQTRSWALWVTFAPPRELLQVVPYTMAQSDAPLHDHHETVLLYWISWMRQHSLHNSGSFCTFDQLKSLVVHHLRD